jgi:hypothetical protein
VLCMFEPGGLEEQQELMRGLDGNGGLA